MNPVSPELERIAREAATEGMITTYGYWHGDSAGSAGAMAYARENQSLPGLQHIIMERLYPLILSALKQALTLQVEKEKEDLGSETPLPLGLTSEETGIAWGSWVKGEWDEDQPECVRCYATMSLRDGCEWSDFPELNLCEDCVRIVLEELRPNRVPSLQPTSSTQPTEGVIQEKAAKFEQRASDWERTSTAGNKLAASECRLFAETLRSIDRAMALPSPEPVDSDS